MRWLFVLGYTVTTLMLASGADAESPLRVAANIPLTGELAVYGNAIRDGALLAEEQLQASHPDETAIEFDWQDNQGNNATTNSILKAQLLRRPDIYVSGLKPQTMVISDRLSQLHLPHFTWILDTEINPKSDNNLRVWVSFKAEGKAFLSYLKSQKIDRVAMFYANLPAAEAQYNELLAPELRKRGTKEILIESYPLDTSDFRTLALRIKKFLPDVIILNGFTNHLVPLVRALREYQLIHNGNTMVSIDMLEAATLMKPAEVEGVVVAAPSFLCGMPTAAYSNWEKSFQKKFGRAPVYHSAYAFDMVQLIDKARKSLPVDAKEGQLLQALRAAQVDGITGSVSLDADGSLSAEMFPAAYKNGKLRAF